MGVIVTEVYDALVSAGAPEEKARAAAGAVRAGAEVADKADIARINAQLDGIDTRLGAIESRLSVTSTIAELARTRRELREQIAAPNWKSIVIQTVAIAVVLLWLL